MAQKKTLRFSFASTHFSPIGLRAGKRFKFNRQSVWSAAHLGTATDQDQNQEGGPGEVEGQVEKLPCLPAAFFAFN